MPNPIVSSFLSQTPSPPSPLAWVARQAVATNFNAKTQLCNERGEFAPLTGGNEGGWILVHGDMLYLVDPDKDVKLSVMRLVLHSTAGRTYADEGMAALTAANMKDPVPTTKKGMDTSELKGRQHRHQQWRCLQKGSSSWAILKKEKG